LYTFSGCDMFMRLLASVKFLFFIPPTFLRTGLNAFVIVQHTHIVTWTSLCLQSYLKVCQQFSKYINVPCSIFVLPNNTPTSRFCYTHTRLYKLLPVYNATRITHKARNGNYISMGTMVERTYVTS
jgi:hypothetical protein